MLERITPVRTYVIVALILLFWTLVTVGVSFIPLGPAHFPVALGIAAIKATLVILFFMHARFSRPVTRVVIMIAILWLAILLFGTMQDYLTRSWLGVPGH